MVKIGLITGITGQDGSYLAELLLKKEYIVYGVIRRSSTYNLYRIENIINNKNLILKYGDITENISYIFNDIFINYPNFDLLEIYNLAAQSHVKISFDIPEYTANVDAIGTLKILEFIKNSPFKSKIKFYQASTSELYGNVVQIPQTENTPFFPISPYAIAKLYGFWIVKNYRDSYNIFACNGILFNHESKRRGEHFITRKITICLGKIVKGIEDKLIVGNIYAKRDWGHAKDYVEGMWKMLQCEKPDDYILATNTQYSVKEFIEKSFKLCGFDIKWKGEGVNTIGYDSITNKELIFISKKYFRPCEVNELLGDYSKANKLLNWKPTINIDDLIKEMVDHDVYNK